MQQKLNHFDTNELFSHNQLRGPRTAWVDGFIPMIVSVTVLDADFFSSRCVPLLIAAGGVPRTAAGTTAPGPAAIHPVLLAFAIRTDQFNNPRMFFASD